MSTTFAEAAIPGATYKINSLTDLSPQALGELRSYIEQAGLAIPISQVTGFQQFTARSAADATEARRNSATFGDPTTGSAGPSITGVPAGAYVLLHGATAYDYSGGGGTHYMGVKINSSEASDATSIKATANANAVSLMAAQIVTLTVASNTLTLRYRISVGEGRWDNRFLIALRYANA